MKAHFELRSILKSIDGKGYKSYEELEGEYKFGEYTLYIDHVQGDPFASPSRIRVRVAQDIAGVLTWKSGKEEYQELFYFIQLINQLIQYKNW